MAIQIENEQVKAFFSEIGAELISLQLKSEDREYIWQGNPEFWGRRAPVLFPFVGRLKNDSYRYLGKSYPMGQHGFARDKVFEVINSGDESVAFSLKSTPETKKIYPFDFELVLSYELIENNLIVNYQVENTGNRDMFFSIGGHPAFNVPLTEGEVFEDYYLEFVPRKTRTMLPLKGNFIDYDKRTLAQTNTAMQIRREFFQNDAFILETKGKTEIRILTDKNEHGVALSYDRLPYVGIWSPYPKEAPFVCIEPWEGVADTDDSSGELEEKLGIKQLEKDKLYKNSYTISIF